MKIKNVKLEWYAFRYDTNKNQLVFTNILAYMKEDIAKKVKKGDKDNWLPVYNYDTFKNYIKAELIYRYWCKSEHECLISNWTSNPDITEKHDIWWQLEPNLDRICEYIIKEMDIKF